MVRKRNVYLNMKPLEEAREILLSTFAISSAGREETVSSPDAVGRVLARPVFACISSPNFHSAAMDGIAVDARSTYGTNEGRPRTLEVGREAFFVNTGHPLPEGTNAVIMIEQVQTPDDKTVKIEAPAFPWQHVRRMGEDIVATELVFPRNHKITPYCVGALLSGGVFKVSVYAKPKVGVIPTGSELIDWRENRPEDLRPGQVLETNSYVLEGLVKAAGGEFKRYPNVSDDPALIRASIENALADGMDLLMTVGGSSAGSEDYTKAVFSEMGEILVHGVTMMPGKPVLIGKIDRRPIFGMPGYPVSAIVAFEQFVHPLISRMLRYPQPEREILTVETTRKIPSKLGVEEFLRVKLGRVGSRIVATPLPRGAGSITTITEADGIIRIPNHVEGLKENESVAAELLRPRSFIENTLVAVGSHDNTLDLLADMIRRQFGHLTLSSSHVGSMGGLMAVKRGVCHLAGAHLLDTDKGTYNVSYIHKYLPEYPVRLIHLVRRDQGLIIAPGNPKDIRGIEDLGREELTFINRQPGSGTRILLDYRLGQIGMGAESIRGYQNEEFTHMAVAAAVASGTVDTGLGICAAARALGLDFIPVVTEDYDLVIPEAYFESEHIRCLLDVVRSAEFKKRVEALGGYDTVKTGTEKTV